MVNRMKLAAAVVLLAGMIGARAEGKKPADPPFDDTVFVKTAAIAGMTEIEIAKAAVAHTKNADVKKFAEGLIHDHTKSDGELAAAAKAAGITVPDKIDDAHQKQIDGFKNYKGDNFDRDFLATQVQAHTKVIELFTQASKEAKHAEIKDFAKKTLPTLQTHLETAKKLQK